MKISRRLRRPAPGARRRRCTGRPGPAAPPSASGGWWSGSRTG